MRMNRFGYPFALSILAIVGISAIAIGPTAVGSAEGAVGSTPLPTTITATSTTSTVAETVVSPPAERASLIWDTDLIDTTDLCCYADVDDHYDLLTIYTQTRIPVAGIVIDRGWLTRHPDVDVDPPSQPGHSTLDAMETAYSRHIPRYVGIDEPFDATRCDQPPPQTNALAQLVESNAPVVYATTGTVRQLAWTICAHPQIQASIVNVIISGGDSDPEASPEWNQAADPAAFQYVMDSGMAVTWLPAFDGGLWQADRHATYATGLVGELLDGIPQPALDQLHLVYQRGNAGALTVDDMLNREYRRWSGQFITAINPASGRIDPEPGVFTFEQFTSTVERIVIEDRASFAQWSKRPISAGDESTQAASL